MKKFNKIAAALLVLVLLVAVIPAAYAAADYTANPGDTVVVEIVINDILGIDGNFTVVDNNNITTLEVVDESNTTFTTTMSGAAANGKIIYNAADLKATSFKAAIKVPVSASAKEGDKITIILEYRVTGSDGELGTWNTVSKEVVVEIPGTTPPTTDPQPTPPPSTEPQPTPPVTTIDYTKLQEQIAIAETLDGTLYTAESWANLLNALQNGRNALYSRDQSVVDAAADALEAAIKALVELDYSKLRDAIETVETFLGDSKLAGKLQELLDALANAKELLNSGDQAAMDAAADELLKLLADLQKIIDEMVVEKDQIIEKPVPTDPTDPFCNIPMHHVWPILFFISLALNLVFIGLVVVYFVRRKKNETDDTPLVDYDIGDDLGTEE